MGLVYIANLESGLNVRNALNSMFSELYGSIQTPLIASNISVNTEISGVPGNTYIDSLGFNMSGTAVIRIGTTAGGNDILDDINISGFQLVLVQQYFASDFNIFITFISGTGTVSLRFNVINNYL